MLLVRWQLYGVVLFGLFVGAVGLLLARAVVLRCHEVGRGLHFAWVYNDIVGSRSGDPGHDWTDVVAADFVLSGVGSVDVGFILGLLLFYIGWRCDGSGFDYFEDRLLLDDGFVALAGVVIMAASDSDRCAFD